MFDKQMMQQVGGGLAIVVVALIFWAWLSFAAARTRRHFETLLHLAAESADPQSEFPAAQRRLTALRLIVNAAKYIGAFSVAIALLLQLNVRVDSLLLPAGFLSAALALGAQGFVRDIVAGFFLIFEGQFSVGDIVSINATQGTVEEVGLRVTRLRDDSGQVFFFPNGAITSVSKFPRRAVALQIWLPLPPQTDSERVSQIIARVLNHFDANWDWNLADLPAETEAVELTKATATPFEAPCGTLKAVVDEKAEVTPASPVPMEWQRRRIAAHPARVAWLREKLPLHLASALTAAGLTAPNGAVIEVVPAPFEA